jgi:hypothetical protein
MHNPQNITTRERAELEAVDDQTRSKSSLYDLVAYFFLLLFQRSRQLEAAADARASAATRARRVLVLVLLCSA